MTDTSNDTASGGLENDMPGIGNAPASPSMVPQGLGGLVSSFARMFSGAPAPRAPGPGRSPWQSPGQSQIPQTPHPDAPRWAGTTASLFLPKGSEQPPSKFTPFIGTLPKGDMSLWGKPEEYPNLPESHELPGIYKGLGQFFSSPGQGGSGLSVPLAFAMTGHADEYIKGLMQGQEFKAKMAREQMVNSAMKLQMQQELQHTTYADHGREFYELAGEDKRKMATLKIKGMGLMDTWLNDARQMGDTDFENMIESGASFDQLMRFQDYRDAKLKDLQKANAKAQEQAEDDKMWEDGNSGDAKPQEPPGSPFAPSQPQAPSGFEAPTPSAPSGKEAPSMTASNDPDKPSPDAQETQAAQPTTGLTPEDAATLQAARGYELDPKMAPHARQKALHDGEGIKAKVADIIANPNLSGEQVRDAVRAIPRYGPSIDAEMQGVSNYTHPIGGQTGISTGGRQGEWSGPDGYLAHLVKKYNPTWNQAYYHDRDRFRTDATTQMTLLRTSGISADANAVLEDLKVLEHSGRAATGLDLNQVIENAKRDPMYAGLAADWQAYNDAFNTIVSGGRHTVSGTREQAGIVPTSYASPAAFRAAIKGHMNDAYGMIEGLHRRWESIGGKKDDMPSYDANLEKNIRDIRDMDWLTGTYPGDPWTNPKTGKTKIWSPKPNTTRNPYDPDNWKNP